MINVEYPQPGMNSDWITWALALIVALMEERNQLNIQLVELERRLTAAGL